MILRLKDGRSRVFSAVYGKQEDRSNHGIEYEHDEFSDLEKECQIVHVPVFRGDLGRDGADNEKRRKYDESLLLYGCEDLFFN